MSFRPLHTWLHLITEQTPNLNYGTAGYHNLNGNSRCHRQSGASRLNEQYTNGRDEWALWAGIVLLMKGTWIQIGRASPDVVRRRMNRESVGGRWGWRRCNETNQDQAFSIGNSRWMRASFCCVCKSVHKRRLICCQMIYCQSFGFNFQSQVAARQKLYCSAHLSPVLITFHGWLYHLPCLTVSVVVVGRPHHKLQSICPLQWLWFVIPPPLNTFSWSSSGRHFLWSPRTCRQSTDDADPRKSDQLLGISPYSQSGSSPMANYFHVDTYQNSPT